jgi:xylulokinase
MRPEDTGRSPSATGRFVLGVDVGTSALKCVVLDAAGRLLDAAERSYPTHVPAQGWAEQAPEDWLVALRGVVADLRGRAPERIDRAVGLGLCSAAHLPVLLDESDAVVRPAILWSDQRSGEEVATLAAEYGSRLRDIACNDAGCTWTLPQLLWVRRHEPAVFARATRLFGSKDYLAWRLTGVASMDPASAAATLMYDLRAGTWSAPLVAASGLPPGVLPAVVDTCAVAGRVTPSAAWDFGLPAGLPVVSGTLDSAAELIGCGVLSPAAGAMIRLGSAGGIMAVTPDRSFRAGMLTYPHPTPGLAYRQAGTSACATSLRWLRDLCRSAPDNGGAEVAYDTLDALSAACAPGADGLLFHPYLQGERAPYWNPDLRGGFTGLDLRHGWPQIARAVMEGVAFSLRDCRELFRNDGQVPASAVMTGGVTRSAEWPQIVTDVLGIPTWTVRDGDSALGAAMIAAVGTGVFPSLEDAVAACVTPERTFQPAAGSRVLYDRLFDRYRRVGQFLDRLDSSGAMPPA